MSSVSCSSPFSPSSVTISKRENMSQKRVHEDDDARKRKRSRNQSLYKTLTPHVPDLTQDKMRLGIIEKVALKNFMCHSNLEFVFGTDTRVHFITGRNGSGKSAVLNGIMLALGGKSSATQRNPNIKGFIQTGKHVADISVTLCNVGVEAYKQEEYGDRITISRRISDEGGSSYKICNAAGKVMSQRKEEISNILNALNVQIENPVCILTQEASRCFLESKDAKKKYEFFLKATQLLQIHQHYLDAELKRKEAKETCERKVKAKNLLSDEVSQWKQQVKKLKSLDEKKEKVQELESELVWAYARDREKAEQNFRDIRDKVKASVDKAEKALEEAVQRLGEYDEVRDKLHSEQHEKNIEVRDTRKTLEDLSRQRDKIMIDLKSTKSLIDKLARDVDHETRQIETLRKSIEELKARSLHDIDEENRKREREIHMLEEANRAFRESVEVNIEERNEVNSRKSEYQEAIECINKEIRDIDSEINMKQKEISRMRDSMKNRDYLYGPKVPELRQRILEAEARNLFHHTPIGPIGLHINVTDQKWAFAIEKCLGNGLLQSFCCHDMSDRKVLMSIMQRVYGRERLPSIFVSPFLDEVHNVEDNKVVSKYPTILDTISCDDNNVYNCLIDQRMVESTILIESSEDAANVMMDRPPKGCRCAFTRAGDQLYPYPKYYYYSCPERPEVKYLHASFTESDIKAKSDEIEILLNEKRKKIQEKASCEEKISACAIKINKLNDGIRCISHQYKVNEEKIKSLQIVEDPTDVTAQEEDLKKHELTLDKIAKEHKSVLEDYKQLKEQQKECETERDHLQSEWKKKREYLSDLMGKIHDAEVQCERMRSDKANKAESVKAAKLKLREAEEDLWSAEQATQEAVQKALQVCPKVDTVRKPDTIKHEMSQLENALQERISAFDRDSIMRNYHEKQTAFNRMAKDVEELNELIKKLKGVITSRLKKYKNIRSVISVQVKILFSMHMKVRGYVGAVSFNHEEETLDIKVNIRDEPSLHKTNSLSGGERSFVTVSLLMALFDVAEMPFHILDEYDVFMDRTNKDASMNVMMEKAKEQSRDQFIFITPLDLPHSIDPVIIKVHKMPDPERKTVRG